ncbi:MAG: acyl-CoA dehydrogenase family protein, partial [Acidobacteria bacterium]|nr:acyl-CoA dehydrogenase family protein [Acidobacteriota bacterium]
MEPSPPPRRTSALDDPRLLPFLPLVYVAWADGDLTADEIGGICARVRSTEGIDSGCQDLLAEWLDPQRPPGAEELQRILRTIRRGAASLPTEGRRSLTDLGMELLESSQHEVQAVERQALEEVEKALGLPPGEAARALLVSERPEPEPREEAPSFPAEALTELLDSPHREVRQEVRAMLAEPAFAYRYGLSKEAYREHVLGRLKEVARRGYGALSYPESCGGRGDSAAFIAVFETLAHGDLSLLVKFGVQFGLFGGSILQLGTEKHHLKYLPEAGTVALPGCFAMSESGHGSNVRDVETTATYEAATEEFVIHTPKATARKDWIGNAAAHGRLATVFAQLHVGDEAYGVHAFLVPLRDRDGRPLPGVEIADCGEKLGLNGVDNGRLAFDRVRIPRENLLDRFAKVAADGTYTSPIPSPGRRFFTMLGTLVGGRVSVALAGLSAAKNGLAIAVRYGARRRQFGPEGRPETPILDYLTHQRR